MGLVESSLAVVVGADFGEQAAECEDQLGGSGFLPPDSGQVCNQAEFAGAGA
ncbi:MAG: hypothetical protein ACRDQ5_00685 [Sciscionella sp.]